MITHKKHFAQNGLIFHIPGFGDAVPAQNLFVVATFVDIGPALSADSSIHEDTPRQKVAVLTADTPKRLYRTGPETRNNSSSSTRCSHETRGDRVRFNGRPGSDSPFRAELHRESIVCACIKARLRHVANKASTVRTIRVDVADPRLAEACNDSRRPLSHQFPCRP